MTDFTKQDELVLAAKGVLSGNINEGTSINGKSTVGVEAQAHRIIAGVYLRNIAQLDYDLNTDSFEDAINKMSPEDRKAAKLRVRKAGAAAEKKAAKAIERIERDAKQKIDSIMVQAVKECVQEMVNIEKGK